MYRSIEWKVTTISHGKKIKSLITQAPSRWSCDIRRNLLRYIERILPRIPTVLYKPFESIVHRETLRWHQPAIKAWITQNHEVCELFKREQVTRMRHVEWTHTWQLLRALPNASIDSMSRWFVGSSSTRKFGIAAHIRANATLDFCPPERELMVCRAKLPLIPKLPSIRLYSSIGFPEANALNQ